MMGCAVLHPSDTTLMGFAALHPSYVTAGWHDEQFPEWLISRENGQTAAAVLPRLPSRYEPRDQKSPFGMHEADSHHETLGIEPGWEEGSLGMRKPHQRFDEPITSKPDGNQIRQQLLQNRNRQAPSVIGHPPLRARCRNMNHEIKI